MRIVWDRDVRYRGFFSAPVNTLSIVSSHLSEKASGKIIGGCLQIVKDQADTFCDMELTLSRQKGCSRLPFPEHVKRRERVEVELDEGAETSWHFDETIGYVRIGFESRESREWIRVGESALWLAVGVNQRLVAMAYDGIVSDASGSAQAAWLDEIDAGPKGLE